MRKWSEFRDGTDEAILPLHDIMAIMSTPRHRERLNGHYVSSVADYSPEFLEKLKKVTRDKSFWDPNPR